MIILNANEVRQSLQMPEAIEAMKNYEAPVIEKWIDDIRKDNGHI